jgi:hypothetical protein
MDRLRGLRACKKPARIDILAGFLHAKSEVTGASLRTVFLCTCNRKDVLVGCSHKPRPRAAAPRPVRPADQPCPACTGRTAGRSYAIGKVWHLCYT